MAGNGKTCYFPDIGAGGWQTTEKSTTKREHITLLKKDIRDVTRKPTQKIYAILSKSYSQDKYTCIEKLDKDIDLSSYRFSEEIENIIDRDSI